jgi:hypothetical protein
MEELEKSLRVGLAKIFEHYPNCALLTGIFSAPEGNKLFLSSPLWGRRKHGIA